MNSVVHSVLGKSPYFMVGEARADKLPDLAVGDVVSIVNPHDKTVLEGYYGGRLNDQSVTVVARAPRGGWTIKRVHPMALKLVAWQGRGIGPQHVGGKWGMKGKELAAQHQPEDPCYDEVDYDVYVNRADDDKEIPYGEEPMLEEQPVDDQVPDAQPVKELKKGSGVVIKDRTGGRFLGQVTKDCKRTLEVARLEKKDEGKWVPMHLEPVKRADVVRTFTISGGEVPAAVQKELDGAVPPAYEGGGEGAAEEGAAEEGAVENDEI
jgi:hypothetical protein